jgi:hypothetical protein
LPVTVRLPVVICVNPVYLLEPLLLVSDTEPAVILPAPTSIWLVILAWLGMTNEMASTTVRLFVPLIFTPLLEAAAFKVNEAQNAAVSTVTITPLLIVTASDEVGMADPPQVTILLHLPDTEAVLAAASTGVPVAIDDAKITASMRTGGIAFQISLFPNPIELNIVHFIISDS